MSEEKEESKSIIVALTDLRETLNQVEEYFESRVDDINAILFNWETSLNIRGAELQSLKKKERKSFAYESIEFFEVAAAANAINFFRKEKRKIMQEQMDLNGIKSSG